MNTAITSETVRRPPPTSEALHAWWRKAPGTMRLWCRRARTRRQLAELDDRILADVGLDWVEARREAAKPFWQA